MANSNPPNRTTKLILILICLFPFFSRGNSDINEYIERVSCRMNEACSGVYGIDGSLQKNLSQRSDEVGAKYRAAKERVDKEIDALKQKIKNREVLVQQATKEFEQKNGPVDKKSQNNLLIDFVEERLKGKNLDSASIGKDLNVAYGESIGAAHNGFDRFVRAYRKSQVIGTTELFGKSGAVGGEAGVRIIARSLGNSNLAQDYKSLITPRDRFQFQERHETGGLTKLNPADPKTQLAELARNSHSTEANTARVSIEEMRSIARAEQKLWREHYQKLGEKGVQEIKNNQTERSNSGLQAAAKAGVGGALLGLGMTGVEASALYRDLDDCKKKYSLLNEEVTVLKEISTTNGGAFETGNCSNITIDPKLLSTFYDKNLVGPGMDKLITAKTEELRKKQSFELKFTESSAPCTSGLKILDGKNELIELKKSKEGYRFIGIGGSGSNKYSVEVSDIDGELAPVFTTIKCLNEDLTEDRPCSSILPETLRQTQAYSSWNLTKAQRAQQPIFKAIKDDKNFSNSYCKTADKVKKVICSLGMDYEKIQVALSGFSIICPSNSNGATNDVESPNRSQR